MISGAILLVWLLVSLPQQPSDCASEESLRVLEVSERDDDRRVVLQGNASLVERLKKPSEARLYVQRVRGFVQRCKSGWGEDWWFDIYTDAKYVPPFGATKEDLLEFWKQFAKEDKPGAQFLARYEDKTGKLILYPTVPRKMAFLWLKPRKSSHNDWNESSLPKTQFARYQRNILRCTPSYVALNLEL